MIAPNNGVSNLFSDGNLSWTTKMELIMNTLITSSFRQFIPFPSYKVISKFSCGGESVL